MKRLLALSGIVLLLAVVSCQNNTDQKETLAALTDSTSVTGVTGDSVKLVKTASIHLKVKDVEQGTRAVSGLAQQLGGRIYHQNLQVIEGKIRELKLSPDSLMVITAYTPQADITARIPSENLEAFMFAITDAGYFTNQRKMDIDDKSLAYLENSLKQKNRIEELSRTGTAKHKASPTLQTIALKDEAIEQGIANRAIDADVHYSTVSLSLFQNPLVRKEVVANYYISGYQLPFGKRLGNAFSEGWEYFLSFIVVLSHLWMFIMVAVLVWIAYKYGQKKRKLSL